MKRLAVITLILAQIGFWTVCPTLVHAAMMNDEMGMRQGMVVSGMTDQTSVQTVPMECCKEVSVHTEQASSPITPVTDSPVIIDSSCQTALVEENTNRTAPTYFCATSPPFHERQLGKRE
jgi:hypothetical protein